MIKYEQKFQTKFNNYVKNILLPQYDSCAFAFELKHTRGKTYLNFSEVKSHQIAALLAVKNQNFVYKISDSAIGQKPFDSIAFKKCLAYVVVKYPKNFYMIGIDSWIAERNTSTRKSLTEDRAKEINSACG